MATSLHCHVNPTDQAFYFRIICLFSNYLHEFCKTQGQTAYIVTKNPRMFALTMFDCKKCNFLMNFSSPLLETALPKGKFGRMKTFAQSVYNQTTHNVDRFDQHLNLYSYNHRMLSWKRSVSSRMLKFATTITVSEIFLFPWYMNCQVYRRLIRVSCLHT